MEAFLLLSDAANADTGSSKVDLLGTGWSITGPNVPPAAISAFLRAPWGELSGEIQFRLRLVDAADQDVRPFADSDQPLSFDGAFTVSEATQLDGMGGKIPLNAAFCMALPPLPLQPGHIYRWVLEVAGDTVASVDFAVRSKN